MATKLVKGEFPNGHNPDDFTCFGPPSIKDGEFDGCFLADLGCFTQDGKDSNKYYHGSVCQSKKNNKFYAYFEWGRTGSKGDIQFVECLDKNEAQIVFSKQMHEKNDKRGQWVKLGGMKVLQAKPGKDCYLVRPQAKRTVGLPDAQKIIHDEGGSIGKKLLTDSSPKKTVKSSIAKWDAPTLKLMKDMNVGAINFARAEIQGGAIPTQSAIDEVRDILIAAKKRIKKVGNVLKDQIEDTELRQLTYHVYSRIPKVKRVNADESTWILSADNIDKWDLEVDAFENALAAIDIGADNDKKEYDPFEGMPIEMIHLTESSREGDFLINWMKKATKNRHGHIYGDLQIANMWAIKHKETNPRFEKCVDKISGLIKGDVSEKPICQPQARVDLADSDQSRYNKANVGLLFHGTRSVNVTGILRTGLKLPKELVGVAITGAMFGPGAYFADDWKKSDGYTSRSAGYWSNGSGGVKGRKAFMFITNVILGKAFVAPYSKGYTSPPNGYNCVFGKAGTSGVQNNEWIIYDVSQHDMPYLVEYDVK